MVLEVHEFGVQRKITVKKNNCTEDRGGSTGGNSGTQFSGECQSTSPMLVAYVTELKLDVVSGE